ncbi:hypothetical protein [Marinomonas sp. PE14-40]|uniref:hypothetical protein n=1 Tax=Marinomonas sp. PE14-40 TaxID=3060621 RepID=UPI003F670E93
MIKFALVMSTITFLGCSSVQHQAFSLNTNQDFKLEEATELEFSTLCEQLSVIAFMNLLDKDSINLANHDEEETRCSFSGSQTHSGYSFGFTYQSSDDTEYAYSDDKYLNKASYTKSKLELNALKTNDSIDIYIKASNQDQAFEKLTFLVDKLLLQEYRQYYTDTKTQKIKKPRPYYDD